MTPVINGVADTARWVAMYRATESERPDAVFRDPFARRLGGARGAEISAAMPASTRKAGWVFVARTVLFDRFIQAQVAGGVTLVVNLAAGLDTRPYRLPLPPSLKWIEVDQPALLAEKTALLAGEQPVCALERVALDLEDDTARRAFLDGIGRRAERVLVVTEGLLIYLREPQVGRLAADLAAQPNIEAWATDLLSPSLLRMVEKEWGKQLREGGAPMHFAPETGPAWFAAQGWQAEEVRSTLITAAGLRRLPFILRCFAALPGAAKFHPKRPWSGALLLTRRPAR